MTKCYMLPAMSNVLQHQHKDLQTTADIILNLEEMFGEKGRPARQATMRALMSTKMLEGTHVQKYVLMMMDHLNTLEILGASIDGERQIDIILESLPDSFNHLKLNYNMCNMDLTLAKVTSQLQVAEDIIKVKPSAYMAKMVSTSS